MVLTNHLKVGARWSCASNLCILKNGAVPKFFAKFFDLSLYPEPRNLLELMFDPNALRPHIQDWEQTAQSLLGRVVREAVGRTLDDKTRDLMARLQAFPSVDHEWAMTMRADPDPVVPISFVHQGQPLRLFSLVTVVGTPQTIAAQELRLEAMFPLDAISDAAYRRMIE